MDPVMGDGRIPDDTLTLDPSNVRGVEEEVRRIDFPPRGRHQYSGVDHSKGLKL